MGQLLYGVSPASFDLDDRTLAHVELVVLAKLRRNESFALILTRPDSSRTTLWIHPSSVLQFDYQEGQHDINREWLDQLVDTANSPGGMRILPEPGAD
jgi:hypothetical protein